MLEAAYTLDEMRLEHRCMGLDTGQVRPDVSQSQGNAVRYKQVRHCACGRDEMLESAWKIRAG